MHHHQPSRQGTKKVPFFKLIRKHLLVFSTLSIAFLLILAIVIRLHQQTLTKDIAAALEQTKRHSEQLITLQTRQNQYYYWWKNERLHNIEEVLYDVQYRVRLANLYYTLGDNANALKSLTSAVSLIHTLNDQRMNPLKTQIKSAINTLDALSNIDQTNTIFKLDTINTAIQTLPIAAQYQNKHKLPNNLPASKHTAFNNVINKWIYSIWSELKQLIIIRRADPDDGTLLKENTGLIKQMVSIKLLQAQQALLVNNIKLYQHNIHIVIDWLNHYFSQDNPMIQELKQLQAYEIQPPENIHLIEINTMITQLLNSMALTDHPQMAESRLTPEKKLDSATALSEPVDVMPSQSAETNVRVSV
jgi:uncharacterized protein HemX